MIGRRVGKLKRIARFLAPAVSLPSLQAMEEPFAVMLVRHPSGVMLQAEVTGRGDCLGRDGNSAVRAGSAPYGKRCRASAQKSVDEHV